MRLRNLKAEAAATERRRVAIEERRGNAEREKIATERAVVEEQLKTAQADRMAAEARYATAALERDRAAQERDAVIARESAKDALIAELRVVVKQEAEKNAAADGRMAKFMATVDERLQRMETHAVQARLADLTERQRQSAEVAKREDARDAKVSAKLTEIGNAVSNGLAGIPSKLDEIARMPIEMTAKDEPDGTTKATMQRKPG